MTGLALMVGISEAPLRIGVRVWRMDVKGGSSSGSVLS